jgi:hypothetical protein
MALTSTLCTAKSALVCCIPIVLLRNAHIPAAITMAATASMMTVRLSIAPTVDLRLIADASEATLLMRLENRAPL